MLSWANHQEQALQVPIGLCWRWWLWLILKNIYMCIFDTFSIVFQIKKSDEISKKKIIFRWKFFLMKVQNFPWIFEKIWGSPIDMSKN